MALESIAEASLAVASDRHEKAVATLGPAVRPIYRATNLGNPDHEGSCVLVELNRSRYMVTASHVIEAGRIEYSELYVGGEKIFVRISGETWRTQAPDGVRKDPYDFAIWKLSDDVVQNLGDVVYIGSENMSFGQTSSSGHVYSIIGFPNTRNESIDREQWIASSKPWSYFSVARDGTDAARTMGVDGENHIFIGFDKYSRDSQGRKVKSISPRGVSGGAVIDLGNLGDPHSLAPDARFTPRLVAIFIEYRKTYKVTVATKLGLILKAVEAGQHR
ncbi:putative serine/cysteine peptidase [Paraburkholderia piptadeniae]|uniref:Serine/cysteine peptidase n=1 Tax=Paraburkholderia piptadeniae TaxID=1701573 RepID=A0A1N7SPU5_9BURK|nr:hypothetical protein [Paraburkholderia piptadeniae]SIT49443.1 putative serine/cysteine peptidase [Paraburkholderia piptadeniae]